uniref:Uncharacterized protein n=1 Tax=Populus trichocarpa TaxID=3694 RepID=U5G1H6_POPTR
MQQMKCGCLIICFKGARLTRNDRLVDCICEGASHMKRSECVKKLSTITCRLLHDQAWICIYGNSKL